MDLRIIKNKEYWFFHQVKNKSLQQWFSNCLHQAIEFQIYTKFFQMSVY